MIDFLVELDHQLFSYLNGLHTPFWDTVMVWITNKSSWLWWYVLMILGIFYQNKNEGWLKTIIWVIAPLVLGIIIADHTASSLFKPLVGRLRPCYQEMVLGVVHSPVECGGKFSFFSSHASTSFAIAYGIYLILRKGQKLWSLPVFIWACIFSYSRIYVGKHFLLDILCGAICGFLCAYLAYKLGLIIRAKVDKTRG